MQLDQKPKLDKPHFPAVQNIEVGYDHDFLQRWMRFEKVAWIVMVIALIAGLAGVFGRGPLAKTTVKAGDGTEIRFERVARNKTPALVEIRLPETLAGGKMLKIRIEGDLLNRGRLQRIVPQPAREIPISHGLIAEIPIDAGDQPGKIDITQEPGAPGRLWNRITLENTGTRVEFSQIVLP